MTGTRPTSHTNPSPFNQLRQQMTDSFSLEDVRILCFDLNVNFDELPHAGLTPKIRNLILLLKQNGRLEDLLTAVAKARPHVDWPELADLEADTWPENESDKPSVSPPDAHHSPPWRRNGDSRYVAGRAQRIAQSRRKDVTEVLADAIVLTEESEGAVQSEMDEAIERERAAYLAMHSALLDKYKGEYVAVYQGQLIDHDPDFGALYTRVNRQYPDEFVLIRQVETQPERTYHFRSPRFAEEK